MSGRIALHLDRGLGWTKPVFVAGCGDCGTELARHTDPGTASRTAAQTRCPACGTRVARRLPGITSPATDFALASGRHAAPARRRRLLGTVPPRGRVVGREPGPAPVDGRAPPPPTPTAWEGR